MAERIVLGEIGAEEQELEASQIRRGCDMEGRRPGQGQERQRRRKRRQEGKQTVVEVAADESNRLGDKFLDIAITTVRSCLRRLMMVTMTSSFMMTAAHYVLALGVRCRMTST